MLILETNWCCLVYVICDLQATNISSMRPVLKEPMSLTLFSYLLTSTWYLKIDGSDHRLVLKFSGNSSDATDVVILPV